MIFCPAFASCLAYSAPIPSKNARIKIACTLDDTCSSCNNHPFSKFRKINRFSKSENPQSRQNPTGDLEREKSKNKISNFLYFIVHSKNSGENFRSRKIINFSQFIGRHSSFGNKAINLRCVLIGWAIGNPEDFPILWFLDFIWQFLLSFLWHLCWFIFKK